LSAFGLTAIVVAAIAIFVSYSRKPEAASADPAGLPISNLPAAKQTVFLIDLPIVGQKHWPSGIPSKVEPKDKGPKDKGPKDKGPKDKGLKGKGPKEFAADVEVSIRGTFSPHGIFMHPPPPPFDGEPVSIGFRVDKRFSTFASQVSINDGPEESESPCVFRVFGDGKLLWESKAVSSQADTQRCSVTIDGVDVLRIEVVCAGEPRGAHCVWIEPRVAK
jgi:hypothetical protein